MNVENRIKDIIKKIANKEINVGDISIETVLSEDLGFDSVMLIELVVGLENEFSIEIDDDDLEIDNLDKYSNLIKMIIDKVQKKE